MRLTTSSGNNKLGSGKEDRAANKFSHCMRNIIEQCNEFQKQLEICFIDFKKAFDSVHRESLWKIVELYGIPTAFIEIFKNIYEGSSCCIKTQEGKTEYFDIETGVRQGCILSSFLFLIAIDFIMKTAVDTTNIGLQWNKRRRDQTNVRWPCSVCDGSVGRNSVKCNTCTQWVHQNCSGIRLSEYTKTWSCPKCKDEPSVLADLDFADDIALLAGNRVDLQNLTDKLSDVGGCIGMRISSEKTKTMSVGAKTQRAQQIVVGNETIDDVERFTYLGSILATDGGSEIDAKCRIGKAAAVFRRLEKVWKSQKLDLKAKLRLYHSIVLPTVLYSCETWKVTEAISKKLDVFHQRCLRRILKISYRDHVTNKDVLERTQSRRLRDIVTERRMRFAGHILRLDNDRCAKMALFFEPSGNRKRGRPKHTWRKTFKEDLASIGKTFDEIETTAANRDEWKLLTARCVASRHRTD
jgi:hypothetical protein